MVSLPGVNILRARPERVNRFDVVINNQGSLFIFHPLTAKGKKWVTTHTPIDAANFGGALVVEPRYALDLASSMIEAGLRVE